jgi:hypothetical protein
MQAWETRIGIQTDRNETDMPDKNNSKGRLIAADFFSYTLKAFLIGIATSVVLGGAVILLAQSTGQDDAALGSETPAIQEAK